MPFLLIGGVLFPEHREQFRAAVARGRELPRFFDVDYRPLLPAPFEQVSLTPMPEIRRAA